MDQQEKDARSVDNDNVRTSSGDTIVANHVEQNLYIDPKDERKLLMKMDLHIAPVVMLLYLIAFLDRYLIY